MRRISCSARMVRPAPWPSLVCRASAHAPPPPHPGPSPDKTIKLWKVFEKTIKVVSENNLSDGYRPPSGGLPGVEPTALRLPRLTAHESIVAAVPRKVYANAHAYHINSISINSDGETYISADDLRINLWNLNISDQSFSACGRGF